MDIFKTIFTSALSCMFLLLLVQNAVGQESQPTFRIGAENLIPFEYKEDGEIKGINPKLIDLAMEELGIPYEIIISDDQRAMNMAKEGTVDAVLSVSYKADRESFLIYPEGFEVEDPNSLMWSSEYVLFAEKEDITQHSISSYQDIKDAGFTIGVIDGVSYEEEFWNSGLDIKKHKSDTENFEALLSGEIDAYLTDRIIGKYTAKQMGISDQVANFPKKFINKPYTLTLSKASEYPNKEQVLENFFEQFDLLKKKGIAKKVYFEVLY